MNDELRDDDHEERPRRRWLDQELWNEHVKRLDRVEKMATGHNFALFGHPEFPETGLLARFQVIERWIERLDRNQARWGGGLAVLIVVAPFVVTKIT